MWEALPECKARPPKASSAGYFTGCRAPCPYTLARCPVTAPRHLPLAIHSQQQRPGGGRPFVTAWLSASSLGMRCRRRPRVGMGWLRAVLSPLRRLWCRANAVQRKSTSPMAAMTRAVFLRFSEPCWCLMNGELYFLLVVGVVCRERHLHPVRRRQVVPMRGRARALVDPRGVPRPAAADPDAEPEAVTRGGGGCSGTAPPE